MYQDGEPDADALAERAAAAMRKGAKAQGGTASESDDDFDELAEKAAAATNKRLQGTNDEDGDPENEVEVAEQDASQLEAQRALWTMEKVDSRIRELETELTQTKERCFAHAKQMDFGRNIFFSGDSDALLRQAVFDGDLIKKVHPGNTVVHGKLDRLIERIRTLHKLTMEKGVKWESELKKRLEQI